MKKKIVVFGGGNGLSTLLRGLKQFPLEITAVVETCDDGKSTGSLREEFHVPALGDLRRVIISLAETEPVLEKMFNYRFSKDSSLNGHTIGNLILYSIYDTTKDLKETVTKISDVFNLKGKVLPLTESYDILMAEMSDGAIIKGESKISHDPRPIKKVFYQDIPKVTKEVLEVVEEADMIIFSMGSLFTSIIPNLLPKEIISSIDKSSAKLAYICNIMTQPGETENYTASDHINKLNEYLGNRKIEIIVTNNSEISNEMIRKYRVLEQKSPVVIDKEKINIEIIEDDFVEIYDDTIHHNSLKLAYHFFTYLMKEF